jgi:hypothetical protein
MCPSGCANLHVQPLHSYARMMLNKVLLKCPWAPACQVKLRYEDYVRHVQEGCGEICCKCQCGKQVKQKDIANHNLNECRLTLVECPKCHTFVYREAQHKSQSECLQTLLQDREHLLRQLEDLKFSMTQNNSLKQDTYYPNTKPPISFYCP